MASMRSSAAMRAAAATYTGSGWWADADYDDSTITSFYPPNIPIPPVYYTTGSWLNPNDTPTNCDNGNNIPADDVDEFSPRRYQCRVRRWFGALHQELDQLVELAEHQARRD